MNGTPGMIRTCDPLIRSQVLYPAELRVHSEQIEYQKRVKKWKREKVEKHGLPREVTWPRA